MRNARRLAALVIVFSLVTTSAALACHSNYFQEIFTKIQKQDLSKDQIAVLWKLRTHFNQQKSLDHSNGHGCRTHDRHVPEFIAAAAGVLTDAQFTAVTGEKKTETQKLRFEVNQLKKELAEIKALLLELKAQKS